MVDPVHVLPFIAACLSGAALGQVGLGAQAGPLFFRGVFPEPTAALSNTSGFAAGLQFTEGGRGESGFRIGVDYVERNYRLYAQNVNRLEHLSMRSSLLWFSAEIRWPLSKRAGVFFDLGPVIGVEVREERSGESWDATTWEYRGDYRTIPEEVETGFAIRDARWRMGLSADMPIGGGWLVTAGAHVCPGVGNWARGNNYATLDGQLRAGLMRRFGKVRKHG